MLLVWPRAVHAIPVPASIEEARDTQRVFSVCPNCTAQVVNMGRHNREHCPNRPALRGRPPAAPAGPPPAPRYFFFIEKWWEPSTINVFSRAPVPIRPGASDFSAERLGVAPARPPPAVARRTMPRRGEEFWLVRRSVQI